MIGRVSGGSLWIFQRRRKAGTRNGLRERGWWAEERQFAGPAAVSSHLRAQVERLIRFGIRFGIVVRYATTSIVVRTRVRE
eukprot:COSAG01_NODE_2659_length_7299_cov_34.861111_2_plen_81_part_00